jgi:hypothetical protein
MLPFSEKEVKDLPKGIHISRTEIGGNRQNRRAELSSKGLLNIAKRFGQKDEKGNLRKAIQIHSGGAGQRQSKLVMFLQKVNVVSNGIKSNRFILHSK